MPILAYHCSADHVTEVIYQTVALSEKAKTEPMPCPAFVTHLLAPPFIQTVLIWDNAKGWNSMTYGLMDAIDEDRFNRGAGYDTSNYFWVCVTPGA